MDPDITNSARTAALVPLNVASAQQSAAGARPQPGRTAALAQHQRAVAEFGRAHIDTSSTPTINVNGRPMRFGSLNGLLVALDHRTDGTCVIAGTNRQLVPVPGQPGAFARIEDRQASHPPVPAVPLSLRMTGAAAGPSTSAAAAPDASPHGFHDIELSSSDPSDHVSADMLPDPVSPHAEPGHSRAYGAFAAAVSQSIATGLTFGLKAYVEAAVQQAVEAAGMTHMDAGGVPASTLLANMVGGAFVGVVHNAVSASVGAYVLSKMGGETYRDVSPGMMRREVNDGLTATLPVYGAFVGAFGAGRALTATLPSGLASNLWVQATARFVQSTAAGFLQGGVTAAAKSVMTESYVGERKEMTAGEVGPAFLKALHDQYDRDQSHNMYRNGIGKLVGGVSGMVASTYLSTNAADWLHADASGRLVSDTGANAGAGAAGMFAFLSGWFTAVHSGSIFGQLQQQAEPAPDVLRVRSGDARADDPLAIQNPTFRPDQP